ncbi:MAG: hypothetical protein LRZ85_07785 [Alphaproteobacteria bacterium]|nr:hypothetical protein [Alphaproteobacteria bacterium]MCD8570440.1 hypothetical protein [Alphaproteobacteria bacterium]
MTQLSWHALNSNKDYDYALPEILHYCYTMEMDGAQRAALSLVLGHMASTCMNYVDYENFTRHIDSDPEAERLTRVANFEDYMSEHAQKRLALLEEHDPYLETRIKRYHSTRMTVRVLEGRGINPERSGLVKMDEVESLIETLVENLVIQGIPRLPLARALADAAFVYARLSGREAFKQICRHIAEEGGVDLGIASSAISSLSDTHRRLQLNTSDPAMQDVLGTYGAFGTATVH